MERSKLEFPYTNKDIMTLSWNRRFKQNTYTGIWRQKSVIEGTGMHHHMEFGSKFSKQGSSLGRFSIKVGVVAKICRI